MATQTKMLQILIDGQKSIRDDTRKIKTNLKKMEKNLTKRIDNLGLQIARLEDDTPTISEFDKLEKRVSKVEGKVGVQSS